jgi:hypothetical protein
LTGLVYPFANSATRSEAAQQNLLIRCQQGITPIDSSPQGPVARFESSVMGRNEKEKPVIQARLAAAACPGKGDQVRAGQQAADIGDLPLASPKYHIRSELEIINVIFMIIVWIFPVDLATMNLLDQVFSSVRFFSGKVRKKEAI